MRQVESAGDLTWRELGRPGSKRKSVDKAIQVVTADTALDFRKSAPNLVRVLLCQSVNRTIAIAFARG